MRRKQVYIDADLDEALARLAARTHESEAAHVRRALRSYLERHRVEEAAEPYRTEGDPLLPYLGAAGQDEGPTDSAEAHDHYLYGAPKAPTGKRAGRKRGSR